MDVEEHEARVAPEVRAGLTRRETRRQFREQRRGVEDLRVRKLVKDEPNTDAANVRAARPWLYGLGA